MVAGTALDAIERVVVGLGGELDVRVRWRGEELDRLLDAVHAALGERLVEILAGAGWQCAVEVTFWIRGEKGSVDLLAWHPTTGRLLVVETKSVVPDLQQMPLFARSESPARAGDCRSTWLARDRGREGDRPGGHLGEPRPGRAFRSDAPDHAAV